MSERGQVYVVDDDGPVRHGLAMLLESAGYSVTAFGSAAEFLAYQPKRQPACLILDINMPVTSGLQLQDELRVQGSHLPVIFLTGHGTVPAAVRAIKGGAVDFLQKPLAGGDELIDTVSKALAADVALLREAAGQQDAHERFELLTPREREVMERVCEGHLNKVIAIDLGISERTVELHRGRVMKKTGVRTVPELVRMRDLVKK